MTFHGFHDIMDNFPDAAARIGAVTTAAEWEALDDGHVVLATTVLCALGALAPAEALAPVEAIAAMVAERTGHRADFIRGDLARVREKIGTFAAQGFAARLAGSLVELRGDDAREDWGAWVRARPTAQTLAELVANETARREVDARLCAETAAWLAAASRAAHGAAPWGLVGPALVAARWAERAAAWDARRLPARAS